ncbi:hypothetical protein N7540_002187 [Penicillium herquei]|nr:hypothetical protein N7540_002187 [Penicillium herquei]
MYRDHLISKGHHLNDNSYGLYQRVFLSPYLRQDRDFPGLFGLLDPKPWPGNPIAALRRGFAALGSPRIYGIDTKIASQLEVLRKLYFGDYDEGSPRVPGLLTELDSPAPAKKHRREQPEENEDDDNEGPTKAAKLDFSGQGQHMDSTMQTHHTLNTSQLQDEPWTLGPYFTTEQIIQRYSDILPVTEG